jgi:hypothetical protein
MLKMELYNSFPQTGNYDSDTMKKHRIIDLSSKERRIAPQKNRKSLINLKFLIIGDIQLFTSIEKIGICFETKTRHKLLKLCI